MPAVELKLIKDGPELDAIRELFREYQRSLNVSLCFQGFEEEVKSLPGEYAPPDGRLILCMADGRPAGCIALKRLDSTMCEMKRLFVRPEFRQRHLGRTMSEHLIEEARNMGYLAMRLDTIRGLLDIAISLYHSLGFHEIAPYYHNPIANAVYLELDLRKP